LGSAEPPDTSLHAPPSEELRRRLAEFAARWGAYQGSERAEAQTFLNELLACYGTDRQAVGAKFEESTRAGGFMDMIWPGTCIIEMKRPSEADRLDQHRGQALQYWQVSGERFGSAPPYVVLCAFQRFEVWRPGEVYTKPKAVFDLATLPENADALLFLEGREPGFFARDELTRDAVALVTDLYQRLDERDAADHDVLQDFVLQIVWCMFAEDLGMLPGHLFTRLLDGLLKDPSRSSFDDLGRLFRYLAEPAPRPTHGVYEGTPFADGGLFRKPAEVHLETEEVDALRKAADFDWTQVEPAIFGALLQGALGKEKQWALGAHYTAEADILKVVLPTIVEPWRERVEACETVRDVQAAQRDLMNYVVLDPACGSGNFLYVAYRELRRVEAELRTRGAELRRAAGMPDQAELALYPITNLKGIEIEIFAVKLARVTMWIGHKLAVEDLGVDEPVLPLVDLSGIRQGDALRIEWPRADAIISNPPYHGSQFIRRELGDEYAEWLKQEFGVGLKDYAVYWFRKAHEHLEPEMRAGLVATNSVSQGRARSASLEWITENRGVITNAISKQPWSGEAVVNVSIVNWVKDPRAEPSGLVLDGEEVDGITPALQPAGLDVSQAQRLLPNARCSFQGVTPAGEGFVLDDAEAAGLFGRSEADYSRVVRAYLTGDDITSDPMQKPTRWIVDFATMPLEEARQWPAALEIVEQRVRPARETNRRKLYRERWWLFAEARPGMRKALGPLARFAAANRYGKRVLVTWQAPAVCPSGQVVVFGIEDDYAMGILSSRVHSQWAWAQSSTMRVDIRYTPTSAFETFPWPTPTAEQREEIGSLAAQMIEQRQQICAERQIGLTTLYNEVDEGAYADLRKLHDGLDKAVATAYGWPASAASEPNDSNRRLLELNQKIATGEVEYAPFGGAP
jgi:hypothetical protein